MITLKVLVVDNEEESSAEILDTLKDFTVNFPFSFEKFVYEPIHTNSGERALEIIDEVHPDIILLANGLSGMRGIKVLEQINTRKIDTQVVMITSHASLELAVKATTQGAYDFIVKPFNALELKTSIEKVTKHLFLLRMTRKLNTEGKQIRFQFLSVLSHELKAPLNAIEGYLNMLKDKSFGESVDDYKTMIDRSLTRIEGMRNLIFDLLDFTKIESQVASRNMEKVNVTEIAKISIDTLTPTAIQKDISVHLFAEEFSEMMADKTDLEIIFNNLISNAIKYNQQGGSTTIRVEKKNGKMYISVSDTGIGMTKDDLTKLFNDFVRIRTPKTKNISGSGLGLSIVKKIANLYNGSVSVDSEPEKGSTFSVILPLE
jgi:signal transduction histidine kinase